MAPQPRITHSPPPVNDAKSPRSCPSLVERRTVEKWGRVGQRLHLGVSVRRRLRKGHVEKRNKGREGEDPLIKQVLRCVCQAGMFNDHFQTDLVVGSSPSLGFSPSRKVTWAGRFCTKKTLDGAPWPCSGAGGRQRRERR